jgi:DNA polymerase-3 subunit epsilon
MRFFRRSRQKPAFVHAYEHAQRPDVRLHWRAAPYTVLDVETSGLNPRVDALLAIGLVDIEGGRILLERHWHTLVRPPKGMIVPAESIRVHQLLREDVAQAPLLTDVLTELLQRLSGRVLVVHVADVDISFINRALLQLYDSYLRGPAIDTARLAASRHYDEWFLRPEDPTPPTIALRALSEQANLPVFPEHNALNDALTTAQLFLAQATHLSQHGTTTLKGLLRKGGCLR